VDKQRGLMPCGYSRFDIVAGHAAFADWWNSGGTTPRDWDPKRAKIHYPQGGPLTASVQLSRMKYRPAGDYMEQEDYQAQDVYLELVRRYFPESFEKECRKIDDPSIDSEDE
jgi:hypothetical protein